MLALSLGLHACSLAPTQGTSSLPAPPSAIKPSVPAATASVATPAAYTSRVSVPASRPAAESSKTVTAELKACADADAQACERVQDLWGRLRGGFALDPLDEAKLAARLRADPQLARWVEQAVKRAEPYLYLILQEVERRGLPSELALLPAIESAFSPQAVSPKRAAGLWQVMPRTARGLGLKQDRWYDGRRDILASTEAALDYLEQLHAAFDGDWLLALASYNAGQGAVSRAISRNEQAGRSTDYWSLPLPTQTRQYVPKLLTLCALIAEPDRYGVNLEPLANQPVLAPVELAPALDLDLAAELAGLSLEDVFRYNPGFRGNTVPEGPHRILIPAERESVFQRRLASYRVQERHRIKHYKVRRGDTLGTIATRYGTSVAKLRGFNRLETDRLQVGAELLIPVTTYATGDLLGGRRSVDDATATPRTAHRVGPGDSLSGIALRYGVNARQLARWNRIGLDSILRVGQRLLLGEQRAKTVSVP